MATIDAPPDRQRLSAVLLTRNEEALIERCVESLHGVVDDIVVLDSCSTDRTREIATRLGARVFEQSWLGWIDQRARAIELALHDWVFVIEADEFITPALARSIVALLRTPMRDEDGYAIDRRDDFLGALLPRMKRRSKRLHFVRIFNRRRSRYDPTLIVHDEVRIPGRAIPLDGALIHWRGFTIAEQVARYAAYAPLEASVLASRGTRASAVSVVVRPLLRFGWCFVARGGLRLGARGFMHALMVACSEFLRYATLWEQQHAPATLHPPADVLSRFELSTPDAPLPAPSPTPSPRMSPGLTLASSPATVVAASPTPGQTATSQLA